jgi:hypothetical protein
MKNLLTLASATGAGTAYPVNTADQSLVLITGGMVALATLTVTTPSDTETVTIGVTPGVTYTFRTALSTGPTIPNEVLVGTTPSISLDNLKSAVNATAGAGTTYSTGTVANPGITATTKGATTLLFVANVPGTVGNAYVSTETMASGAFGGTTFASGSQTATGSTVTIESTPDGVTWVTELSLANPTMGTVLGSTHQARLGLTKQVRANVTVFAANTLLSAFLQSWRRGDPVS